MGDQRTTTNRTALEPPSWCRPQTKKRLFWHTTFGQVEVEEQRYRLSASRRQIRPFSQRAGVACRACSPPLQRALVDFAADVSFDRATEKLLEHYGVELSTSTIRRLTQRHGARLLDQQQQ